MVIDHERCGPYTEAANLSGSSIDISVYRKETGGRNCDPRINVKFLA